MASNKTMKAYGITEAGGPEKLKLLELPIPTPTGRDLLVRVKAVATNPVDCKVRNRSAQGETKILGWDASGIVEATGAEATLFKAGDEVYFAGSVIRQGCDAEFVLVDERITGKKPRV